MECNKEEAVRAKEIAEKKLSERDFQGAKKFALKAQSLSTTLDGLSQFLEVIDLYIAHEKKINGEVNHYKILGVDPFVDDEVLKKKYKKMALSLHPDKNNSVGADGAFKILSQAWGVLSNKDKRAAYDSKIRVLVSNPQASADRKNFSRNFTDNMGSSIARSTNPPPTTPTTTSFPHFVHVPTRPRTRAVVTNQPYPTSPHQPKNTVALDANSEPIPSRPEKLPCKRNSTPTPTNNAEQTDTFWTSCNTCKIHYQYPKKTYLNKCLLCSKCQRPFMATEMPPTPSVNNGSRRVPSASAKRDNRTATRVRDTLKRKQREEGAKKPEAVSAVNGGLNAHKVYKRRRVDDKKVNNRVEEESQVTKKTRFGLRRRASSNPKAKFGGVFSRTDNARRVKQSSPQVETRGRLVKKAKFEILTRINKWNKNAKSKPSTPKKKTTVAKTDETVLMNVPDADFHTFDDDRVEDSFSENQIWAAYDDDDGMPRFYAMVHRVISRNPFKMQISWLNSKTSNEFGPLNWIGLGFAKTSGEFRVGKSVPTESLNLFSHQVKWTKGPRGAIKIFPTKGDIWALYKNWSPEWNELTTDETIHQYSLVMVVESYDEDRGVVVAPLVKAPGFTCVFHQDLDQRETLTKEEMFRFSHQVPFYVLSGAEAPNSRQGWYELDPAALPMELLTNEEAEKVAEPGENVLTYCRRSKMKKMTGEVDVK